MTIILKTGDHAHTHTRASRWGRSLTEPPGVRRFILGRRSAATDARSPRWESPFTVWRQQSADRQQQVRKYVSARVKARVSSRGKRKMEPAVKRTQEKLWLGGLLWWSLLLQLVYGGNFFFVLVCPSNKPQVSHDNRSFNKVIFTATPQFSWVLNKCSQVFT